MDIIYSTYHVNMHNIPTKSMRLMVKVVWTFKNGVEGAVLISLILWFSFSLLYYQVQVQCILKMSVPILRIYIDYEKRVAPPRIYFWSQDSIEDYSPTWHGSVVIMNKTIVMLGVGWKERSVSLSMLRVNQNQRNSNLWKSFFWNNPICQYSCQDL